MAQSGFEGFEKRLELNFFGDDPMMNIGIGLRQLSFESVQEILDAVQCTVVSAMGNQYFDAYVLSESSLFVYPTKIIIKTCGTTQLLKSISPLLSHAHDIGLNVCGCRYTRGNFIFPKAQPFPHTSFKEEVMYLEESLPNSLCYRKASVMPSNKTTHSWHVYSASTDEYHMVHHMSNVFTMEVCMTELDRVLARKFYQHSGNGNSGDISGKEMTMATGINDIIPSALICDFSFDPCGYSMNGVNGVHYSTIHVTPEDGYSYASFELMGFTDDSDDIDRILNKVVQIFRPSTMSVSTTCASHDMSMHVKNAIEQNGLIHRSCTIDEFPAAGSIVFQTFTTRRK
ncbi:S-adenosylmethionine decarboxylase proenzyme [Thalictrum thalictroides]|uniref:S-adenosylmethionine decarboxylase proenzyme n=1 Tax=Thalictrum thalictroides TaxID=46969 RepID=A0A7J6WF10_THATH|nr:S-adenosylmethionine decarboxylase proenzyme [Thalictrum thalictroides]